MNLADIGHMFDYTDWANDLTLKAAALLSEEQLHQDFGISHGSIIGTLRHMAGAEWIWLERWHGRSPQGPEAWSLWKAESCADLETLNERWSEIVDRRARFISELDQALLPQNVEFNLISGAHGSLPLAAQMQHVVNHATLHRGQVVGMIRQLGLIPPATDLLYYLRR